MSIFTRNIVDNNRTEIGVASHHPEYMKWKDKWTFIRDCVEGEDAIKAKSTTYLPKAAGMTDKRYDAFLKRARFVNYVDQTLEGVHGMVFRRSPVVEYPDEMKDIMDNLNREGDSFYQFFSDAVYDIMQTGFGGFLVDLPDVGMGISLYEAENIGARPYVTYYPAESIINWKFKVIRGTRVPVLVVLEERVEKDATDEFGHELKNRYRVLDLDDNGFYRQLIYEPIEDERGDNTRYSIKEIPVIVNGDRLNYIPFVFAPENFPTKPMLLDIAHVNIGHYLKTADYENGVHLTTLPTGYVTGEKPEEDKDKNIIPMVLGQDNFLMFPNDKAKVGTLVFSGEGLTHSENAIEKSELQMVVLGSRIITPEKGVSETAESANIHRAGENAKLATFARNLSEKATQILKILRDWSGNKGTVSAQFNTDYETMSFDANSLNAIVNMFEAGKMPLLVLYGMLMKGEFISDPNMSYADYIELLDLEHSGLTDKEVYDAYKRYMQTGKSVAKNLPAGDRKEADTKNIIDPTVKTPAKETVTA